MKISILCFLLIIHLCQSQVRIRKQWDGGFHAAILVPTQTTLRDWKLEVQFDIIPNITLLFGDAEMNTTENKVIFQSKDLGVSFLEGSIFNLEFSADGGVKPDNLIGATLNNQTINLTLNFEPPGTEFPFEPVNITGENNGYNYSAVLYASLLFYESQRSGKLPQDKRISWRGDSMLNDAKDGSKQIDLVGGYFSEGDDFNKDSRKIAGFTTMLAWGVIQYEDAYIEANQLKYVHDAIRWSTDYLMKAHTNKNEFYRWVGDPREIGSWSSPEELQANGNSNRNTRYDRYGYKITCENPNWVIVGETAASLAAASIVFRKADYQYHVKLLKHAEELYIFAKNCRGTSSSRGYKPALSDVDEVAWAAAWLYRATNQTKYFLETKNFTETYDISSKPYQCLLETNQRTSGVQTLLAQITKEKQYLDQVENFCNYYIRNHTKTPKGLVYIDEYYSLPSVANLAFVCLQAADMGINTQEYFNFSAQQIGYMLGNTGRSFVVGVGQNYPERPLDMASSCPQPPATCNMIGLFNRGPNPHLLVGALVGGPNKNDKFEDDRSNSRSNQVSIEGNAGFQSTVAGLLHHQMKNSM